MTNTTEPLIIASDFESIKLKINLTNTTTKAEIRDGKRCYDKKPKKDSEENLIIVNAEFLENGLLLEIPSKMCAQNHNITIEVITENSKPIISFTENLKVKSVEKLSADSDLIETAFVQKSEANWNDLQKIYTNRQNDIRDFFNSVRGFDGA